MAAGTLFLAILIFAVRGYFLGFAGALTRIIGVICAYFVAFSYRGELAAMLVTNTGSGMHPLILTAISSAILFFGTLFLVSFIVLNLFRVLSQLFKPLRVLLDKEAVGSRIAGSLFNGAIGAALVLMGLWFWGITLGKGQHPDELQRFANRFGDTLLTYTQRWLEDDETGATAAQHSGRKENPQLGTAEIVSTEDPRKRMYLEKLQQVVASPDSDPADWFTPEQIRTMVNDPNLRKQVKAYIDANPEAVVNALNNPKIRELLEQMDNR